jgi:hypothetical protein
VGTGAALETNRLQEPGGCVSSPAASEEASDLIPGPRPLQRIISRDSQRKSYEHGAAGDLYVENIAIYLYPEIRFSDD